MTDYNGVELEVGDIILRAIHGILEKRTVLGITKSGLKVNRLGYDMYKCQWGHHKNDIEVNVSEVPSYLIKGADTFNESHYIKNGKWYKRALKPPLYIKYWSPEQFIIIKKNN